MESPEAIRSTLSQYHGTEQYWLVFPENDDFKVTDGVHAMVQLCEAYWLITAVFSWQSNSKLANQPFQVWILRFNDKALDDAAVLICEDGDHNELIRQEISFSDFPLPEGIKLFLEGGVLLLPSEH